MALFNYIHWNIDSDFFVVPFINHPIRWYGILWTLGLFLSYKILSRIFIREGKSIQFIEKLTLYIILGTIVGARLGHVIFYELSYYLAHPLKILAIYEGGLASHGGGLGIFIAIFLFAKNNKTNFLYLADRLALVIPLTGVLIRIGNLMNSEIIGSPTNVPWAFIFDKIDQIPRHPTQLYEAFFCIILFLLLYYLWNNTAVKKKQGNILGLLMVILFTFRFFVEFIKNNQVAFESSMIINMGQILSIPFVLLGIIILLKNIIMKSTTK